MMFAKAACKCRHNMIFGVHSAQWQSVTVSEVLTIS